MGIGRRQFLKMAAAALGGIALDPLRSIFVVGDYYVNTELGLGFVKPSHWNFDVFKDFASSLEGQIVQGLDAEAEEEFRKDQASTLVAAISKYDDSVAAFGPSITVFKNREDRESPEYEGLESLVDQAIDGFAALLKDYEVIEPQKAFDVSNCPAMRLKSRWVFEHRRCEPKLIDDETLIIDQGTYLYSIHLYDSPYTGETATDEFRSFLDSLHIA